MKFPRSWLFQFLGYKAVKFCEQAEKTIEIVKKSANF